MKRYSPERKNSILKQLLTLLNRTVAQVARREGMSDCTLGASRCGKEVELCQRVSYRQSSGQLKPRYLFEDIFSRKAVCGEVYEQESGELAAGLLQRIMLAEQCFAPPPALHSDNGAPMKSLTLFAKM